jgi:Universal stress protein family
VFRGSGRSDPQPTELVAVLLASTGGPFRPDSVRLARDLAAGGPIGVLTVVRIYGSSFGLPNPGLLPTAKERKTAQDLVDQAIRALRTLGVRADGQVLITRHPPRGIARVAKARSAQHVVVEATQQSALRRLVEGGSEVSIRRRLGDAVEVTSVPYPPE